MNLHVHLARLNQLLEVCITKKKTSVKNNIAFDYHLIATEIKKLVSNCL